MAITNLRDLAHELEEFSLRLDWPRLAGHEAAWLDYAKRHLGDLAGNVRRMQDIEKDKDMQIDLSLDDRAYLVNVLHARDERRAKTIERKLKLAGSSLGEVIENLYVHADGEWRPSRDTLQAVLTGWAQQLEKIAAKELTRV